MMGRYDIFRDVADAWKNLRRRPLRSLLSSLGIGIGVTALVTMLSISEGAKRTALSRMHSLGVHTIRIERVTASENSGDSSVSRGLRYADRDLIAMWLEERGTVSGYLKAVGNRLVYGSRQLSATVVGIDELWLAAEKVGLAEGRAIYRRDIAAQNKCAIVGSKLASELGLDLLSVILLNNDLYTVVGIARPRGRLLTEGTGLSTLDFDSSVFVPMSVMPGGFSNTVDSTGSIDGLVVALDDSEDDVVMLLAGQIQDMLQREHLQVADFNMVVPVALIERMRESQRLFATIMGAIASLSLVVGGIGVMNIMLANIAEQTREIGLRMAIGASRGRIVSLYLWNAVLLTFSGCCWGMLLGGLAVFGLASYAGWDVAFSAFGLWIGPISAVVTGLVFGLHPAIRAADLDPARALRES